MAVTTISTCSIDGCEQSVHGHGWCGKHYRRWVRNGGPTTLVRIPRDEAGVLRGIQEFARQLGRTPSYRDWMRAGLSPGTTTIETWFGSWNAAVIAAGMTPTAPGRLPRDVEKQRWRRAALERQRASSTNPWTRCVIDGRRVALEVKMGTIDV